MLTHREAKYVNARIAGKNERQALLIAGFSPSLAAHPSYVVTDEMRARVAEIQQQLAAIALEEGLVTATELLRDMTEELRGDVADLYDEQHNLKPVSEWPYWARNGGVEYVDEPNMVHSADGDKESWDQVGRRIRVIVKSRNKTRELAMKHKGVNAIVEPKQGDINITVITAEQARKVIDAKKRLAKVIECPIEKHSE